ncbi:hypothetical protein CH366_02795 [Leptospira harrisiae]|uniref:Uncharacterized protein n=1 Tax=Leptospira harrisiae TaxID=2023189 RepID=A0A2N0ALP1_9LEPT|nr:hypothetical protein CH364_02655 [Leptospira harrisiae]PKA08715.1 hypothetical protein CH366_02795 [Leptospira harrisiae]
MRFVLHSVQKVSDLLFAVTFDQLRVSKVSDFPFPINFQRESIWGQKSTRWFPISQTLQELGF